MLAETNENITADIQNTCDLKLMGMAPPMDRECGCSPIATQITLRAINALIPRVLDIGTHTYA